MGAPHRDPGVLVVAEAAAMGALEAWMLSFWGGLLLAGCGRELLDDVTAGFLPWSFKRARWHWELQGGAVAFRNGREDVQECDKWRWASMCRAQHKKGSLENCEESSLLEG